MPPRTASSPRVSLDVPVLQTLRRILVLLAVVLFLHIVVAPPRAHASGSTGSGSTGSGCTLTDRDRRSIEVADNGDAIVWTQSGGQSGGRGGDDRISPSAPCPRQPMPAIPLPIPLMASTVTGAAALGRVAAGKMRPRATGQLASAPGAAR